MIAVLGTLTLCLLVFYAFTTPTHEGPWQTRYEKLATSEQVDTQVTITNFRRARYDSEGEPKTIAWEQRSVDLMDLQQVWFGISVFAEPGIAHTFLSFDFGDKDPIVISVEARQRPGQVYSPLEGALDAYHLIYVIADERDIVGVRTHGFGDQVFFQPLTFTKERMQRIFLDMLARTNALAYQPEFYNTFTSNCTNSLLRDTAVPKLQRYLDPRILLPGFSDRIAYSYGILDKSYDREDLREAAYLDPSTFEVTAPDFYQKIRDNFYLKMALKSKRPE